VSDSVLRTVQDALIARLQTVAGDDGTTYWYTPAKVAMASFLSDAHFTPGYETFYILIRESAEVRSLTFGTTGKKQGTARFDLVAARRFEPSSEKAFQEPDPAREQIQDRLEQDVRKVLEPYFAVGGLALNVEIPFVDYAAESTFEPKHAVVVLSLEVSFIYSTGTP
jgi:hypothetical protein